MKTPKPFAFNKFAHCVLGTAMLMVSCGTRAAAHGTGKAETVIGLHVYVPLEYNNIDAGHLNKYMGVAELPQVRVPSLFTGLGTQVQIDRVVVNASFTIAAKKYRLDNTRMSAPFATYGFTVGYDLIKSPFVNLQPYAGFRAGKVTYNYENLAPNPAPAPGTHDEMSFRGRRGMLDLGVGASWQRNLLLGVRGGVLVPAGRTKWKDGSGAQLSGGPELSYRYYLGVSVGIGRANIRVKNSPQAKTTHGDGSVSFIY